MKGLIPTSQKSKSKWPNKKVINLANNQECKLRLQWNITTHPPEWVAKILNLTIISDNKDKEQQDLLHTIKDSINYISTNTLEKKLTFSSKVEDNCTLWSSNLTSKYMTYRNACLRAPRYGKKNVLNKPVHNYQKIENNPNVHQE